MTVSPSARSARSAVNSPPPAPDESVAGRADARVAADAIKRHALGEVLNRREQAAIARQEKLLEAKRLARAYSACAVKDVCAILGIQRVQLQRYVSYGLPLNADGSYNLATAVQWVLGHERQRLKGEQAKGGDALERYRAARAQQAEDELQLSQGRLLRREDVERGRVARIAEVTFALTALEKKLPPQLYGLEPRDCQAVLHREFRAARERFAGEPGS